MTTLRQQLGDRRDWDELDRVEAMEQQPMDLNQLLEQWLKEHNAGLLVVAQAPKGGQVNVENFLPDGWLAVIVVAKKDAPAQGIQR